MSEIITARAWRLMEPVWEESYYPDSSPLGKAWADRRIAQEQLVAAWRPRAPRTVSRPWNNTSKFEDTTFYDPDRQDWRTVGGAESGREIQLWSWQFWTPLEWSRLSVGKGQLKMPAGAGRMVYTYWYIEELLVWGQS